MTMEMWTEGLSPVKEIHVATTIIFLAGVVQVQIIPTFINLSKNYRF